jgi:hypothetical protein
MTALIIETVKISTLKFDPENARTHGPKNIAAIRSSLDRFGQRRPIVVHGDTVIAGNGTLQAAKELGWDEITISRTPAEWSKDEAKAYALTDNRTSELAEWDSDVLLKALKDLDSDLIQATGFTEKDISDLNKLWGQAPDLDELAKLVGDHEDDDDLIDVSMKLPIDVHENLKAAMKATGVGDKIEQINLVALAALEALNND